MIEITAVQRNKIIKAVFWFLLVSSSLHAADFSADPPPIQCSSAVLIDVETETLLYAKNPDNVIPPASMTKLITLDLAYTAIEEGRILPDAKILVTDSASFKSSPPRSSLMFLEAGQSVTFRDLMLGLAIPSGNDASIAVAELISGSVPEFVEAMNARVGKLGLVNTSFVEPSGYSEKNQTTAREFSKFCIAYMKRHPEALEQLHSRESFTYPKSENIPSGGSSAYGPVKQYNHNNLIGRLAGIDGLKTGYIDESGYNIAATAERNGRRLLVVTMGGPDLIKRDGAFVRALDVTALFTYGFTGFITFTSSPEDIPPVRVWKSADKYIDAEPVSVPQVTLDRTEAGGVFWAYTMETKIQVPLAKGDRVGKAVCMGASGNVLFESPLVAKDSARPAGWLRKIIDSIMLLFASAE